MNIKKKILLDESRDSYELCEYAGEIRHGIREVYSEGKLLVWASYKLGKLFGQYESFFEDGRQSVKCSFVDDEYDGEYKTWWANGQLKEFGTYRLGKKIGLYQWFDQAGNLFKSHDYGEL